jgi:hypothetical protein
MRLTREQVKLVRFYMEGLLERVRILRDERAHSAPPDDEIHLIFTDGDDYDIELDEFAEFHLNILRGIAIGLGVIDPVLLYQVYVDGLDDHRLPDVVPLIKAAERALAYLSGRIDLPAREVVNVLGPALAPWRGKEWR